MAKAEDGTRAGPRRLGVLGTMVWDRIHARDVRIEPIEEWGGISYALAAVAAAVPAGWRVVPLMKLGRDLEEPARTFLRDLPGLDPDPGVIVVPDPNNRVVLRYLDGERRCERMTGGVPPWTADELLPRLEGLDALYINFISGFELDLETALRVRLAFDGPIYADLHSLLLGMGPDGRRQPRPLGDWRDWIRCFDILQVNESELSWLAHAWAGDPWRFAADVVGIDLRLLLVTLGTRGAAYVASPRFDGDPLSWRRPRVLAGAGPVAAPGAARTERIDVERTVEDGDPTGCGDVWGATCFARLLAKDGLEAAVRAANRAAGRNAEHRGATGLYDFLQGRITA